MVPYRRKLTTNLPRDTDIIEKSTFAAASWEGAVNNFRPHPLMFVEKET
jgi:hypothetical protein